MELNKNNETREFVEKCLTTIIKSMDSCQTLLIKQLSKDINAKTELATRKSYDALERCTKRLHYYKDEMEPDYCDECGTRLD